jgi:hypothetical protein
MGAVHAMVFGSPEIGIGKRKERGRERGMGNTGYLNTRGPGYVCWLTAFCEQRRNSRKVITRDGS